MVKKSTKDKSPSTELIEHPGEEEEQIVDGARYLVLLLKVIM